MRTHVLISVFIALSSPAGAMEKEAAAAAPPTESTPKQKILKDRLAEQFTKLSIQTPPPDPFAPRKAKPVMQVSNPGVPLTPASYAEHRAAACALVYAFYGQEMPKKVEAEVKPRVKRVKSHKS